MACVYHIFFILFAFFIFIVTNSLPIDNKKSKLPFWHLPCGEVIESENTTSLNNEQEIRNSLLNIIVQHRNTLDNYLLHDYDYLYQRVSISLHEHQYIPNWVPDKQDVHTIRKLAGKSFATIANHLPKFHSDLQKFAVAIEELLDDEPSPKIRFALDETKEYLKMLLCEVESFIVVSSGLTLPKRIDRNIMSDIEREPVDETRRLVRDWGVLLKYKDYLHGWRYIFDYSHD